MDEGTVDNEPIDRDIPEPANDEWEQVQEKDPVKEITKKISGLLGHINDLVVRLENEKCDIDTNVQELTSDFNKKDVKNMMNTKSLGLKEHAHNHSMEKNWEIVPPSESNIETEDTNPEISSPETNLDTVNENELQTEGELDTCSSTEIVEEDDGPPEKSTGNDREDVQNSEDTKAKSQILNMAEFDRSFEQLQALFVDIRELYREAIQISERLVQYKIKRQHKLNPKISNDELSFNSTLESRDMNTSHVNNSGETILVKQQLMNPLPENNGNVTPEIEEPQKCDPEISAVEENNSEINTDDDYLSQTSSNVEEEKIRNCVVLLKEHLKFNSEPRYQHISVDGPSHSPTHRFRCLVYNFITEGIGHNQRTAKHDAALKMIRLIIKKQKDGILSNDIPPFSNEQLHDLTPILDSEMENYVNHLQHQCYVLHLNMPVYELLQNEEYNRERLYVVQCCLNNFTTIGNGQSKKAARKRAAKEMLQLIEKELQE